ncbi:hypothetical protein OE09_0582 [Flavobacteriaceae bacterium MAR_2010_72]|nr:hypothetical protein OE09_0582 [Flavobacteriaceae bacterium MAR_2010_72]TVZ57770.1 hypothetical protein NA63_0257 [Flavobacteriaceae bacterium MAR_2010_105]
MKTLCLLFLILCVSCEQKDSNWIDRTKHEGLFKINATDKFETYSTQKKPQHIEKTIINIELAKIYFDKIFDEDLRFAVLFIDNKNWNTYAFAPPPGMPQAYYEGNMVLGLGKSIMAQRHEESLKNASTTELDSLKKYYGSEIDLDLFFRDALSIHELGHLYQSFRTGRNSQRKWLDELFGNLCQVAAIKNFKDQSTYHRMDAYQEYVIRSNPWGEIKFTTLDQFEKDYFEIFNQGRNYGWYQTKFYSKAKKLYALHGDNILVMFRDFQIKINAENTEKIDDKKLYNMMLNKFGLETMKILEWNYDS